MLSFSDSNVIKYYLAGDRKLSILHARIRNNCSDLKFDLFSNGISVHATCGCDIRLRTPNTTFFDVITTQYKGLRFSKIYVGFIL